MRRRMTFIGLLILLLLICGCAAEFDPDPASASLRNSVFGASPEPAEGSADVSSNVSAPAETFDLSGGEEPDLLWGRSQLSEEVQSVYDEVSAAAAVLQEEPIALDIDEEEFSLVLTALRIDHPEYFWFDGEASFVSTSLAGFRIHTECTLVYTMEPSEIASAQVQIDQYTEECLHSEAVASARTEYEKILAVYRYIIAHTDYDAAEMDQSIVSAMTRGTATCAGYARTFQYLMHQLGIPCTLALGESSTGEAHGWNMVQCGGQWYQIDVTWGDPYASYEAFGDTVLYTYCMITDEEMYRDHTLVCDLPMPVCTASEYNYYVQEGRQMEIWDPDAYAAAVERAAAEGEQSLTVRFTEEESYREALSYLFENEGIWEILSRSIRPAENGAGMYVTYSQNDLFYEISVLLSFD